MDLRPYLIVPKLVEQPTWGGKYIAAYKGWQDNPALQAVNIGQSYELSGSSKLSLAISDSRSTEFGPESDSVTNVLSLDTLQEPELRMVLGPNIYEHHKKMPLLIKFTQAKGNSFQLHKKPEVQDPFWQPKAESWYFFEEGYITFGINPNVPVEVYKRVCTEINEAMSIFSQRIRAMEMTTAEAKKEITAMIKEKNPWGAVNVYRVPRFTMLDLSMGGLHHSWEEDPSAQFGNIVYEIQQDVADDVSTLRSFDQGKFKDDGTIRKLTIEEYFRFLDTDPAHNNIENAKQYPKGNRILTTKNYFMDQYTVNADQTLTTDSSFAHLFVMDGDVSVSAGSTTVRISKGHSCLVPHATETYVLHPNVQGSVVLKTGIEEENL